MVAPQSHECKQSDRIKAILWVIGFFLVISGYAAAAATAANSGLGATNERVSLNAQKIHLVEGTDKDIAVIKKEIEQINESLKDLKSTVKEAVKRP